MATKPWSWKEIWIRSGCSSGSIYWVLPVSGWFPVPKTIIPEAQEHFLTPSARRHTHLLGGLGLSGSLSGVKSAWANPRCSGLKRMVIAGPKPARPRSVGPSPAPGATAERAHQPGGAPDLPPQDQVGLDDRQQFAQRYYPLARWRFCAPPAVIRCRNVASRPVVAWRFPRYDRPGRGRRGQVAACQELAGPSFQEMAL